MTSIKIQSIFSTTQNDISTSLKRMASGVKLNQAKDGAADYCITSKLNYQLSGLDVAMSNLSHGNNLLHIADSTLENMVEQLTRVRGLCLQAKNGTLGKEELNAIQEEINQICSELERQRESTKYNDAKVFETKELKELVVEKPYEKRVAFIESTGTQYIDTGHVPDENTEIVANVAFMEKTANLQQFGCITNNDNKYARWHFGAYQNNLTAFKTTQGSSGDVVKPYDDEFHEYYLSNTTAGIDGTTSRPANTANSNVSFTLFARNGYVNNNGSPSVGYYTKSKVQDFKIYQDGELIHSYIPVVDYDGRAALYDEITKEMLYNQGSGEFIAGEEVEDVEETYMALVDKEPTILQIGNEAGKDNILKISLGFDFGKLDFDISNSIKTNFAIRRADELIEALTLKRASVGSALNRIETTNKLQNVNKINLSQTKSILADTDIAQEAIKNTKGEILKQCSASLLTQANQITGGLALRLLSV
ncbi:MAG: flagellin, partial [Candidatus Gastranaerophilales bacterium]|nr:flagellin [Candidatus Gastranaerophilales bacterium]